MEEAGYECCSVCGSVVTHSGLRCPKARRGLTSRSRVQRLTYRSGVITGARFTPDGQSVIYSAAWDGKPVEPFIMRIGGPESRPLGLPSAGVLAVSSAGELAVSLGCEFNWAECRGTLARMPLAGGAPRELLEDVFYADWSPMERSSQ